MQNIIFFNYSFFMIMYSNCLKVKGLHISIELDTNWLQLLYLIWGNLLLNQPYETSVYKSRNKSRSRSQLLLLQTSNNFKSSIYLEHVSRRCNAATGKMPFHLVIPCITSRSNAVFVIILSFNNNHTDWRRYHLIFKFF